MVSCQTEQSIEPSALNLDWNEEGDGKNSESQSPVQSGDNGKSRKRNISTTVHRMSKKIRKTLQNNLFKA